MNRHPDISSLEHYNISHRESKQKVSDQIRSAKTTYYDDKLNNCSVEDMFKTINELLHKSNKVIPDTQCPEDLAIDFGRFFVGKVTTIRNEVDRVLIVA